MNTNHDLQVSTPGDLEIVVVRWFDAPRALVFDAHTKPALLRRWLLGPPGWSMPTCEIDLRVGGGYRYFWRNDADGTGFGMSGTFRELQPPARIVHSERVDGDADGGEAVVTSEFVERDGRTRLTVSMRFPSKQARDAAIASGMTDGMSASYDRLQSLLAAEAEFESESRT